MPTRSGQPLKGDANRVAARLRGQGALTRAVRPQPQILRPLPEKEQHQGNDRQRAECGHQRDVAPLGFLHEQTQEGQELELSRGRGCSEDANDGAATAHEPAISDGGGEDIRPWSRPRAPRQHPRGDRAARSRSSARSRPAPVAISRSAAETTTRMPKRSIAAAAKGPTKPKSTKLIETARGDCCVRPAKLRLQRHDQHPGGRSGSQPPQAA